MVKIIAVVIAAVLPVLLTAPSTAADPTLTSCTPPNLVAGDTPFKKGRLVFHRDLGGGVTSLYLYDFSAHSLVQISAGWSNLSNPLNPSFSRDGKWITFTATANGVQPRRHVYAWDGVMAQPIDLFPEAGHDNEDSRFSPDGRYLVFKRDANIAIAALTYGAGTVSAGAPSLLTTDGAFSQPTEASGPTLTALNDRVYFFRGNRDYVERIEQLSLSGDPPVPGRSHILKQPTTAESYYPVVGPADTLYFARHRLAGGPDRIYRAGRHERPDDAVAIPSNFCGVDNSDPAPVDEHHLFFSSTKPGSYKLYYADDLGTVHDLSDHPQINALTGDLLGSGFSSR